MYCIICWTSKSIIFIYVEVSCQHYQYLVGSLLWRWKVANKSVVLDVSKLIDRLSFHLEGWENLNHCHCPPVEPAAKMENIRLHGEAHQIAQLSWLSVNERKIGYHTEGSALWRKRDFTRGCNMKVIKVYNYRFNQSLNRSLGSIDLVMIIECKYWRNK